MLVRGCAALQVGSETSDLILRSEFIIALERMNLLLSSSAVFTDSRSQRLVHVDNQFFTFVESQHFLLGR